MLAAFGLALLCSSPASAGIRVLHGSRAGLLRAHALTVAVNAPARSVVRVSAPGFARSRTVRLGRSGAARVRLTLSGAGVRKLSGCTVAVVPVRASVRGHAMMKASRTLLPGLGCFAPAPSTLTPASAFGLGADSPATAPAPAAGATPASQPSGAAAGAGAQPAPSSAAEETPGAEPSPEPTPESGGSDPLGFVPVPGCDFLDPSDCLLPFPNDYFTKADPSTPTGRRLNLLLTQMPRNREGKPIDPSDFNRNDGFSPGTPIVTLVGGLGNQAAFDKSGVVGQTDMARAFDAGQPVVLIDATDPAHRRQLIWAELDKTASDDAKRVLIIRPGRNLTEGHRYIVALRNLKDAYGNTIQANKRFATYRDRIMTLDPIVEARRAHMESLFTTLGQAGIQRKSLYLAWDFTVASRQDRTERARWMRDDAFAKLGDTNLSDLTVQGTAPKYTITSIEPQTDSRIDHFVEGHFTVPCYLSLPACRPGSRFLYTTPSATLPTPIPGNTMEANFRCMVPRNADHPRVSLYGHGLLGTRGEVGQGQLRDMAYEHNMVFCATDWIGMSSADAPGEPPQLGDVPIVASILLDVSNFPMLADRAQQGFLNFMYLGRLMIHPDGFTKAGDAFPALDTSRLYYDGNSQGGIMGGALMALEPDADHGVLGVPGMNYSTLLNRSTDFELKPGKPCPPTDPTTIDPSSLDPTDPEGLLDALNFSYACPLYLSYPNQFQRQLLFALMQQSWDRAEANGYALHMTSDPLPNTPAHTILMHGALGDHQVAQISAEVEARTIGAYSRPTPTDPGRSYDVTPFYDIPRIQSYPFGGSVFELWDSGPVRDGGAHGTDVPPLGNVPPRNGQDPHELVRRTYNARLQKDQFLRVGGTIGDFCAGRPCHSDGWPYAP